MVLIRNESQSCQKSSTDNNSVIANSDPAELDSAMGNTKIMRSLRRPSRSRKMPLASSRRKNASKREIASHLKNLRRKATVLVPPLNHRLALKMQLHHRKEKELFGRFCFQTKVAMVLTTNLKDSFVPKLSTRFQETQELLKVSRNSRGLRTVKRQSRSVNQSTQKRKIESPHN